MRLKKLGALVLAGTVLFTGLPFPALAEQQIVLNLPEETQAAQQAQSAQSEYRLSKYDVINIVIVGYSDQAFDTSNGSTNNNRDFFSDVMIGPDGYVNLPYAGAVKLAGLTVPEATQALKERLGEYIKIPSMSVMVKQYGPRKVYVLGEVEKQGIYSLGSEYMNVFAAISSAGGITKRGRTKKIAIVRVENGKVNVQEIDFKKFVEKQDIRQNVPLQDGDMVYVPKSDKIIFNEDILPLINTYALYRSLTD